MKNFILAALLLAASAFSAQAQSTAPVVLTTGLLLAAAPPAPSQTISPNAVIATLETGSWKTPSANEPFDSDNKALGAWRTITAETDGWFRDSSLGYAYVSMTYRSDKEQIALIEAHGNSVVYVNGLARAGNIYGFQDTYESWGPRFDYVYIPVKLRKGVNEFVFECRRGLLKVKIHPDQNKLFFAVNDLTAPDLLIGEAASTFGALPIVNATEQSYTGLFAKTWAEGSVPEYYPVGELLPLSILKAPFAIKLPAQQTSGPVPFHVEIVKKNQGKDEVLASSIIELHSMAASETHKVTFFSAIDGSLQYYAVNPPVELKGKPALFLSLHGAGVEAINQAQAYGHKNWGYIVAATNRRPYGYNWENWGRLDALEVLAIAKEKFSIDPNRVYLTGHSMGGHGAWQLGVNYADQFAAVGPSAGWISIWSYRIRPVVDSTEVQKMLVRATKQSDTYAFTTNLKRTGLYILQGAVDDNVPPSQPRSIVENLSKFHKDFIYYEEPGAGHWWDNSDEPGSDCVDWMPMFDFFSHHAVASSDKIKMVDFVTANPAVSSKQYWIEIINQIEQQKLSSITMHLEQGNRKFVGSTGNIALFSIDCSMLSADKPVSVVVDSQTISNVQIPSGAVIYLRKTGATWALSTQPSKADKYPGRCGLIREAFNNRPVFVIGTKGNAKENAWAFDKARLDAEKMWYRGNSAIEIIRDTQFDLARYAKRSVILFGNATTNSAWDLLLKDSPIRVTRKSVTIGAKEYKGDDYACLFTRPRRDCDNASIAVITGTGVEGMKLANLIQYYDQYVSFPDVVVYNSGILQSDEKGVKYTGFFGNDWSLNKGEFIIQ